MIKAAYTYDIPSEITSGIPGAEFLPITENAESYTDLPGAGEVSVLIARQGAVNDMLKYLPSIRWLQLLNAGFEKVDLGLLKSRGIIFTNARSVYCATIAEDVIAKILFLARNYAVHTRDGQNNFWPSDEQLPNRNIDIGGKQLCILGAGFIGREIALRAGAFSMRVVGYDPYLPCQTGFERIVTKRGELPALLGQSRFVVTSLPVTPETRDMVNDELLSYMRPDAFLINVARGEIIDEAALIRALDSGKIQGAAIDVAKREPLPPDDPLWKAKNLLITPHRAAYGDQMKKRMCALIERNMRHYLNGEPMEDAVRV